MTRFDELQALLPTALLERTRWLGQQRGAAEGNFVLYWMRMAIRTDENPALNVAIRFANQLHLPLLVYQGISERCPFASDRHHTFVLQGARDVQQACADKGIGYALHVERPGHRGPHLKTLTQRAAIVVTEDMPTQPLQRWSHQLSQLAQGCVLAVDTACVVPMRLVGKCYERAFEFRHATQQLYNQRLSISPKDDELQTRSRLPADLPFEPVDLQHADLARLVSHCEIDHSIGPVPHTRGGSQAGYRRWQEFKEIGLSLYDQRRNDASVAGTSRLSPYLHYGMVSPLGLDVSLRRKSATRI